MMKLIKASLIILLISSGIAASGQDNPGTPVLIVLDVQEHFTDSIMDKKAAADFIRNVNTVIQAKRPDMEVVFIQANLRVLTISLKGIKTESVDDQDLDPRLYRKINDRVFQKTKPSAFSVKELTDYLEIDEVDTVYLAGLMLEDCIRATTLDGTERGYQMILISDAIASRKMAKAEKVFHKLEKKGAKVITTEDL